MSKPYLVIIGGPTASGKTATAIKIAQHFNTAIISTDSRQFYREMTIGTAAPTALELSQAPHFFVHHKSIDQQYDVADFEKDVISKLDELFIDNQVVVMVGGSGLYIDAVCNGLDAIPDIKPEIRHKVSQMLEQRGIESLQQELARLDSDYYAQVDIKNPRRLQRALEVCYQTGQTYSSYRTQAKAVRNFNTIKLAILCERDLLIQRINLRVDLMMKQGLLKEAESLYPKRNLNSLNTVGYKELFDFFDGVLSIEQAVEKIKIDTRQYAKRQMTWFRKDKDYQWFTIDQSQQMIQYIHNQITE